MQARAAPSVRGRLSEEDARTLHELRVHQIELEMQNEELQNKQEELQAANRRYVELYDHAPAGYCTLSETDLILQTNLTAASMLGIERSMLVKQPFSRFVCSEDMDIYYLMQRALHKSGQVQTAELRMKRAGGLLFWVHVVAKLWQAADGASTVRLVLSDISERKQAQAAQARSDAQYRSLFNAIEEGFCMVEMIFDAQEKALDFRFLEVNPSFVKLTGLLDAKGKLVSELVPACDMQWCETCGHVAKTGQAVRFERRTSVSQRWYDCFAFRFDSAQEGHVAILFNDISERKARESEREQDRVNLEQEVRSRTQQFMDLYDQAPCGYYSLSADGVVTRINQTALRLLGYTRETCVGHRMVDFMTPESAQRFHDTLAHLLETGNASNIELDFYCKDGSLRPFLLSSDRAAGSSGAPLLSHHTMVDIAERKYIAQRLELALLGADLGLWDLQPSSGAVHFSARASTILGYPEGGLGTHISVHEKLVHPDDAPLRRAAICAAVNGDVPYYRVDYRARHKAGHWVWVRSQGKIVARDDKSNPLRAVGTLQDISQEKHLKLESADLLQRIESLIQGIGKVPDAAPQPVPVLVDVAIGAREQQVLQWIAAGCTSAEIGEHLGISTSTAATHRRNLMRKLDLHSTAELTRYALAHKLIAN